ncbi:MAG: FHA domain-containing protein [Planctomycetaceae bacterium]|nr:FHA domain-containing protein [Planctomycetaceae bacterium]
MSNRSDNSDFSMEDNDVVLVLMPVDHSSDIPALAARQGVSTIGSTDDNTLVVQAKGIEPYHCSILVEDSKVLVEAHGSQTMINQNSIEKAELKVGDVLTLGSVEFSVVSNEEFLENGNTASLVINSPEGFEHDSAEELAEDLSLDGLLSPEELFGTATDEPEIPTGVNLSEQASAVEPADEDSTENDLEIDENLLASILTDAEEEETAHSDLDGETEADLEAKLLADLNLLDEASSSSTEEEAPLLSVEQDLETENDEPAEAALNEEAIEEEETSPAPVSTETLESVLTAELEADEETAVTDELESPAEELDEVSDPAMEMDASEDLLSNLPNMEELSMQPEESAELLEEEETEADTPEIELIEQDSFEEEVVETDVPEMSDSLPSSPAFELNDEMNALLDSVAEQKKRTEPSGEEVSLEELEQIYEEHRQSESDNADTAAAIEELMAAEIADEEPDSDDVDIQAALSDLDAALEVSESLGKPETDSTEDEAEPQEESLTDSLENILLEEASSLSAEVEEILEPAAPAEEHAELEDLDESPETEMAMASVSEPELTAEADFGLSESMDLFGASESDAEQADGSVGGGEDTEHSSLMMLAEDEPADSEDSGSGLNPEANRETVEEHFTTAVSTEREGHTTTKTEWETDLTEEDNYSEDEPTQSVTSKQHRSQTDEDAVQTIKQELEKQLAALQNQLLLQQSKIEENLNEQSERVNAVAHWQQRSAEAITRVQEADEKEKLIQEQLAALQEETERALARRQQIDREIRLEQDQLARHRNQAAMEEALTRENLKKLEAEELRLQAVQKEMEANRKTFQIQQEKTEQLQQKLKEREQDLTSRRSEVEELQQDLDSREKQLAEQEFALKLQREEYELARKGWEAERAAQNEQLKARLKGAVHWEEALTAREQEIETRSSDIEESIVAEKNRLQATREELQQLKEEVQSLEGQKQQLLNREELLQSESADWEERTQLLAQRETYLAEQENSLRIREEELTEAIDKLAEEQANLKNNTIEETDRLEKRREDLEHQIKSQKAELNDLQDQLADDRKEFEQARTALETERQQLAEEKESLDDERTRLQKWEESIEAHIAEELTRRLATDRETLEAERLHFEEQTGELTEKEHQIAAAERKLSEAMVRLEKLEKDNSRLQEEKERLEKELESSESRREQVQSMLNQNLDQLDNLKEKIELERSALLEAEMKHMESEHQRTEQLEQLSDSLLTSQKQLEQLESRYEELEEQHQQLSDEKEKLQHTYHDLLEQQEELANQLETLQANHEESSERAAEAQSLLDTERTAQAELEAARAEIETLQSDLQNERNQLEEQETALMSERNQLEEERNQLVENRDELSAEREELETLRSTLKQQQQEIEKLEVQLRERLSKTDTAASYSDSQAQNSLDREDVSELDPLLATNDDMAMIAGLDTSSLLDEPDEFEPVNESTAEEPESELPEDQHIQDTNDFTEEPAATAEENVAAPSHIKESSSGQLNSLRSQLADLFDMHEEQHAQGKENISPETAALPDFDDDELNSLETAQELDSSPEDMAAEASDESLDSEEGSEGGGDEDSIEAYMRRLIARTKRGTAGEEFEASKTKSSFLNKPLPTAAPKPKEIAPEQSVSAEPEPPSRPVRERAKIDANEVRANLNTLREVANANARTALATHSTKQLRETLMLKLIVTVVAMVITAIFAFSGLWSEESYTWQTIAAATIACGMLYEYFRSFMKIKQTESISRIKDRMEEGRDMTIEKTDDLVEEFQEEEAPELELEDENLDENSTKS